jgi:hypothetical protein
VQSVTIAFGRFTALRSTMPHVALHCGFSATTPNFFEVQGTVFLAESYVGE